MTMERLKKIWISTQIKKAWVTGYIDSWIMLIGRKKKNAS